jgi:hypothetical protein
MSDIFDVQTALATLAQQAIYPNGLSNPSVANCNVKIFPGWPIPNSLDADLTAQNAQVSIYSTEIARATTRFDTKWQTTVFNTPTITLSINQTTITINGTISTPQTCVIVTNGMNVYAYSIQSNDTLNSIASNIATIIPHAIAAGNTLTISYIKKLSATVSTTGISAREVAREKRLFKVTAWCPNPIARMQIGESIAETYGSTYRLGMPDGYYGNLSYASSHEIDELERVKCYRRDIDCFFEYALTQTETNYSVAFNIININRSNIVPQGINFQLLSGGDFLLLSNENFQLLGLS